MRFLADAMLGRLARWLRLAGIDCAYEGPERSDDEVLARARLEQRVLLTLDRALAARAAPDVLLLESMHWRQQLREVLRVYRFTSAQHLLTRCGDCNTPLAPLNRSEAFAQVPLHVFQTCADFFVCPSCGRIFWRGTQADLIERTLEEIRRDEESS